MINESEVICGRCKGEGTIGQGWMCKQCLGTGKFDWIENIVGKKVEYGEYGAIPTQHAIKTYINAVSNFKYIHSRRFV